MPRLVDDQDIDDLDIFWSCLEPGCSGHDIGLARLDRIWRRLILFHLHDRRMRLFRPFIDFLDAPNGCALTLGRIHHRFQDRAS